MILPTILAQLEPYEKQPKKPAWKRRMLFTVGIVLAVGLTPQLNLVLQNGLAACLQPIKLTKD